MPCTACDALKVKEEDGFGPCSDLQKLADCVMSPVELHEATAQWLLYLYNLMCAADDDIQACHQQAGS